MLLLLLQSFSKWIIVADFRLNQEYIARTLCENRARPQLKCGGNCQLAKKMAEEGKESQRGGKLPVEDAPYVTIATNTMDPFVPVSLLEHHTPYQSGCPSPSLRPPFHPPSVEML
ncbi:hypothetical protein [Flaviaesturariibacter amylovorans]